MNAYQKVALLYLAHQSEMLHMIAQSLSEKLPSQQRTRITRSEDSAELRRDIHRVAPELVELLSGGDVTSDDSDDEFKS